MVEGAGTTKRVLQALTVGLTVLVLLVVVRTFSVGRRGVEEAECTPLDTDFIKADSDVIHRFQGALRIRTVSHRLEEQEYGELMRLQNYIIHSE